MPFVMIKLKLVGFLVNVFCMTNMLQMINGAIRTFSHPDDGLLKASQLKMPLFFIFMYNKQTDTQCRSDHSNKAFIYLTFTFAASLA